LNWGFTLGKFEDTGHTKLNVRSASGETAAFDVIFGRSGTVPADALSTPLSAGSSGLVYVAAYISASMRAKLEVAGISYVDGTGWVRLLADSPMFALMAEGASRAPRELTPTAVTRLNGRAASKVVRALIDSTPPVGVRELASAAHVSPGTVSKVLPALEADTAVERDGAGRITAVDRRQLLNRWTADYDCLKSNGRPSYFVAPRGIDTTLNALKSRGDIAFSGATAASGWLPEGTDTIVPATQLVVYALDIDEVAADLGLVPVDPQSANVILLGPQDSSILDGMSLSDGIPLAPLPVVLADLLTLPGRYPQQAEALMDALAKTDPAWRP
jgi:hypothetical protein